MDKLVFVVDDNDSNLTMAALALENDFKVLTIPSAIRMFAVLEKKHPDLILLDIEMPEMTGLEAYEKLKSDPKYKDIPVLYLTGHEDAETLEKANASGALGIIKKPFNVAELLAAVKKHA